VEGEDERQTASVGPLPVAEFTYTPTFCLFEEFSIWVSGPPEINDA